MATHDQITSHNLPLVLVNALDLQSANVLITELINNNSAEDNEQTVKGTLWRIVNKYYQVDVEVYPVADDSTLPAQLAERLEAHIIYITEEENDESGVACAEKRWSRGGGTGDVRLLAIAGTAASPALLAWCRRRRYEPVPMRETSLDRSDSDGDDDDDAPFPETYGVERLRSALHAHAWRGLHRVDRASPPTPHQLPPADEDEDEAAVERAEAFAEVLEALGETGARGAEGESLDERLRRAEHLVAVFCRALGTDMSAL